MNKDTKTLIKDRLLSNGNVDIYGCRNQGHNENHFHWGKLFMFYFQEMFSIFKVIKDLRVDDYKYIEFLIEKYQLSNDKVIMIKGINNNPIYKFKMFYWEAFIMIRHGLAVWVEPETILVLYTKDTSIEEAKEIAMMSEQFKMVLPPPVKKFYIVSRENNGFQLQDFYVKEHDICIEDNYNDDFPSIHELIKSSLQNENKNGIILLHGVYGSGKTYYIRNLISLIEKKFIYMPQHMINWISDPSFLPFLTKNENSILIIEDCEDILVSRENNNLNSTALSNLLNLGDGLLSDALSMNVICSFNTNLKKIDDALLRKGRLIARYEFKELEINKAQALADKLGKNITIEKPMTLTDIYNAESMKFENKKANKIGFDNE